MAHPPAPSLSVPDTDRRLLHAVVRAPSAEQRTALRARIVLRCADEHIARWLGVTTRPSGCGAGATPGAVVRALADAPRPGHPPTYTRADRDRLVAFTMGPPPEGTTHWSVREMARRTGMSPSTVHRIWKELGYRPHRTETFKSSTDPALAAKVRDVVGLYLDPPDGANTRHGTTCLFAALEVGTGQVTTDTRARHTGADFLAFMKQVGRAYPKAELHVVLDNVSTHTTPGVRRWLGRNRRVTFHFTPTSASWMNQVETWFGILTRRAIRRGSFRSVQELVAMIDAFTRQWNEGSGPFAWVRTADGRQGGPQAPSD